MEKSGPIADLRPPSLEIKSSYPKWKYSLSLTSKLISNGTLTSVVLNVDPILRLPN